MEEKTTATTSTVPSLCNRGVEIPSFLQSNMAAMAEENHPFCDSEPKHQQ